MRASRGTKESRGNGFALTAATVSMVGVALLAGCAGGGTAQSDSGGEATKRTPSSSSSSSSSAGSSGGSDSSGGKASAEAAKPASPETNRKLLSAADSGDARAVQALIDQGADLETRDSRDRTALLLAATGDHVAAAKALVEAGADPDALDDQHDTPWLVTGVTGSAEMARVLAKADPDYGIVNRYGGTSLIPAGEHGHVEYIREALRNPAIDVDVDHVNNLGWTALLEAIILGDGGRDHQRVVELLLDGGADPKLGDKYDTTPLQHAERRGYTEIAKLLRDAGA